MDQEELENKAEPIHRTTGDGATAAAPAAWRMPEPVFRQSTGRPVKDLVQRHDPSPAPQTLPDQPAVEPQPALAEQLIPDNATPETPSPPRSRSTGFRLAMLAVAIVAMAAFAAGFLALIYFLFLASPGEVSF